MPSQAQDPGTNSQSGTTKAPLLAKRGFRDLVLPRGTEPGRAQGPEDPQEMGERLSLPGYVIRTLIRMFVPEGARATGRQQGRLAEGDADDAADALVLARIGPTDEEPEEPNIA